MPKHQAVDITWAYPACFHQNNTLSVAMPPNQTTDHLHCFRNLFDLSLSNSSTLRPSTITRFSTVLRTFEPPVNIEEPPHQTPPLYTVPTQNRAKVRNQQTNRGGISKIALSKELTSQPSSPPTSYNSRGVIRSNVNLQ